MPEAAQREAEPDARSKVEAAATELVPARLVTSIAVEFEQELTEVRAALDKDRGKLRRLEQQVLLEGHNKAGISRRWRVSTMLIIIGSVLIVSMVVFFPMQLFGLDGVPTNFGYAHCAMVSGGALFMLAIIPADHAFTRFMCGFFAEVMLAICIVYLLVVVSDCRPKSKTLCTSSPAPLWPAAPRSALGASPEPHDRRVRACG